MKQNAATWDRVLRALLTGTAMVTGAFLAPLPLLARVLALGGGGAYMLGTAGRYLPGLPYDGHPDMPGREGEERGVSAHGQRLASAARGDDEALALLVRTYRDRVHRFGVTVCRDGYDADDTVQDAFARLAARPDVVHDPSVLSWLFTVVRNACMRMLRPFARARRTLGERVDDEDAVPSEALDPENALRRRQLVVGGRQVAGK